MTFFYILQISLLFPLGWLLGFRYGKRKNSEIIYTPQESMAGIVLKREDSFETGNIHIKKELQK